MSLLKYAAHEVPAAQIRGAHEVKVSRLLKKI
jgi:hypothetical protein